MVLWAIDLYFQKNNWGWNLHTASKGIEESLFDPLIKGKVQGISSSDDSSSESDLSEPDSDQNIMPSYLSQCSLSPSPTVGFPEVRRT